MRSTQAPLPTFPDEVRCRGFEVVRAGVMAFAVLTALGGAGCGDPFVSRTDETAPDAPGTGPTYHADVAPILRERCAGCHVAGGLAPFPLTSYADAKATSGLIAEVTRSRTMPPFGAEDTPECQPRHSWRDDPRLTEAQIETLDAWHRAGGPEGEATPGSDSPVVLQTFNLPGTQLELTPAAPFVASGESDQFRCFVLDPGLAADAWLNGAQVVPGNQQVVHHAVMYTDPLRASEALMDSSGSYDCFGGANVDESEILDVWVPGSPAREYPPNVGTPITAGSLLVVQIHYHAAGKVADPDLSRVQLRFVDSPEYQLVTLGFGNYEEAVVEDKLGIGELLPGPNDGAGVEFRVPANVPDHRESMRLTLGIGDDGPVPEIFIFGVFNHMHYVGTDMRVSMKHAQDGSEECLLHTPRWDFSWQRFYAYGDPIEQLSRIGPTDVFELACKYDNTLGNPYVQRALHEQGLMEPIDVYKGEETLDEMCVAGLQVLVPR